MKDHWSDDEAEPRYVRVGSYSAIEDKMIREEVNGRSHHTFRAGRPNGGAAKSVRSVISGCHGVPNDLRQILDSRREEARAKEMSIFHERIGRSTRALVKCGFIGLMQIGEVDDLVITWREANVAQHLVAVGAFAFEVYREAGALSFPTQDSAETKHRVDVVRGYRNP